MSKENIVYEEQKNWKFGTATGYYEPATDTIHILLGSDEHTQWKTLEHERKHRSRRNKPTFQLSLLINTPAIRNFMVMFLLIFGVYGVLSVNFVPFFSVAIVYLVTLASKIYEEKQASKGGEKLQ